MQISGRWLILGVLALSFAMAGGAWWYRYDQSRECAKFWGPEGASLLAGGSEVREYGLVPRGDVAEGSEDGKRIAGQRVTGERDLTEAPGLVHFVFALTQDSDFDWEKRPPRDVDWGRALEFRRDSKQMFILLARDWGHVGKLMTADGEPAVLACSPGLAKAIEVYFSDPAVEGEAAR